MSQNALSARRVCAHPGCGTILRESNPQKKCSLHLSQRFAVAKARVTTAHAAGQGTVAVNIGKFKKILPIGVPAPEPPPRRSASDIEWHIWATTTHCKQFRVSVLSSSNVKAHATARYALMYLLKHDLHLSTAEICTVFGREPKMLNGAMRTVAARADELMPDIVQIRELIAATRN